MDKYSLYSYFIFFFEKSLDISFNKFLNFLQVQLKTRFLDRNNVYSTENCEKKNYDWVHLLQKHFGK